MPSLKCTIYYMHTGCPKTKEKNNCHVMHQNVISLLSNRINVYYVAIDLMCLKIAKSENIYYKSLTRFS